MGTKEAVSASYMEEQKARHAGKPLRDNRKALIIGSNGKTTDPRPNIGSHIAYALRTLRDAETMEVQLDRSFDARSPVDCRDAIIGFDPDILVCANGESHLDWFEDIPVDRVHEVLSCSLTASIIAAREFVQETLERPYRKQIIFVGSMAYRSVLNGSAVYCAAKAGLAHFARCLAWELAPKGFDVFTVHPSNTEGTPMTEATIVGLQRYRGLSRDEAESYWGAVLPRAEWLQPEEIANTVAFLCGGKAGYLSGAQLDLAGGGR